VLAAVAGAVCAALLAAGCSTAAEDSGATETTSGPPSSTLTALPQTGDAGELVAQALAARAAQDPPRFAALVSAAGEACTDPSASRRLGDVATIASRWASALEDSRPKAQARTEAQLAAVDWDALVAACRAA
jgi:hypothetical protein